MPAGDFTLSTLFQVKLCLCSLFDLIKSNYPCDIKLSHCVKRICMPDCINICCKDMYTFKKPIVINSFGCRQCYVAVFRDKLCLCFYTRIVKHSVKSFGRYQVVVTTVPGWGNMFNNFIKPSPGSHKLIILWAGCASISFSEMI